MPNRDPLKPWRQVTFIKESIGPRGGEYWWLTLECGHHKAVAIPGFRLLDLSEPKVPTAPKKCRCLDCKPESHN